MVNKKRFELLVVIAFMFLIPLVPASFNLGNYSIDKVYGPGENINGEINISFSNEATDSLILSSGDFSGSISLLDFLEANSIWKSPISVYEILI